MANNFTPGAPLLILLHRSSQYWLVLSSRIDLTRNSCFTGNARLAGLEADLNLTGYGKIMIGDNFNDYPSADRL